MTFMVKTFNLGIQGFRDFGIVIGYIGGKFLNSSIPQFLNP
jgi:hypothetical protein